MNQPLTITNPVANIKSEDVKRSLVKTLSWRIIGTIDTTIVAYIITGTFTHAITIGGIELVSKMVLYYFHERGWNKIKWGKIN